MIRELVSVFKSGSGLEEIKGITYKADGKVRVNPDRPIAENFKMVKLPFELPRSLFL